MLGDSYSYHQWKKTYQVMGWITSEILAGGVQDTESIQAGQPDTSS